MRNIDEVAGIRNKLLKSLPVADLEQILGEAEYVHFDLNDKLAEQHQPIKFVDFPERGIYSITAVVESNQVIETATVGNEGFAGLPLLFGATGFAGRIFCQMPGSGYRLDADTFTALLQRHPLFMQLCHRYAWAVMNQTSQNSACNRVHSLEERCARWLLLSHDRAEGDEFLLTQEFLAQMLGTRRAGVNLASRIFQKANLIEYSRGKIKILDRDGLESVSCKCYSVIRKCHDDAYKLVPPVG